MPRSQIGKCNCCKCKDCKCKVVLYKCANGWSPAPKVRCRNNSIYGKFTFEDSADCGGVACEQYRDTETGEALYASAGQTDLTEISGKNVEYDRKAAICCVQKGCTHSKICLDKKYVFKFVLCGVVESSRSGKHKGDIYYRKICCTGKKNSWKKIVSVESPGGGPKCCPVVVSDECKIILPEGKYEFRFRADAVDSEDHLGNYLEYQAKWCPYVKGKECCPELTGSCSAFFLCSGLPIPTSGCCPSPVCPPRTKCGVENPACDECGPDCGSDPCVQGGWINAGDPECGSPASSEFTVIYNPDNIINLA